MVITQEAEIHEAEAQAALVENAHDDAFTVVRGDDRDAHVDLLVVEGHLNSTVLRDAFLVQLHRAGHDLDAADDGGVQALRVVLNIDQHAVHAVADADVFFQGLDVNVRSFALEGFHQHVGDELDDGRIIVAGCFTDLTGCFENPSAHDGFIPIEIRLKRLDQCRSGAVEFQIRLQHVRKGIEGLKIVGIGHDDLQCCAVGSERRDFVFECDLEADESFQSAVGFETMQVHVFHPGTHGDGLCDLLV